MFAQMRIAFNSQPAQAIVDAATQADCGLIFMGSHGRGGWSSAFLGSVTLKTLTLTHLPILVDRPTSGEISHAQALLAKRRRTLTQSHQSIGDCVESTEPLSQSKPFPIVGIGSAQARLSALNANASPRGVADGLS